MDDCSNDPARSRSTASTCSDLDPAAWADQLTVIGQRLTPVATSVDRRGAGGDRHVGRRGAGRTRRRRSRRRRAPRADELSGGQLRRVQVARALVAVRSGRARIVLADEPTAHLDARQRRCGLGCAGRTRTRPRRRRPGRHPRRPMPLGRRSGARPRWPDRHRSAAARRPATPRRHPNQTLTLEQRCAGPRRHLGRGDDRRTASDHAVTTRPATCGRRSARVLTMARPARRRFVGAAALGTAAEMCTIGLAGAAAWLIVRAAEQPELAALSVAILGVRAFGTGKGVFRYAERLATHDTGLRSLTEIRAAVVARLAEVAPAGIPGWQRGDLLQRVVADIDRLLDLFVRVLGPSSLCRHGARRTRDHDGARRPGRSRPAGCDDSGRRRRAAATTVRGEMSIGPALNEARATLGGRVLATTEGLDQLWANRMLASARTRHRAGRRRDRRAGTAPCASAHAHRSRRHRRAAADGHRHARRCSRVGGRCRARSSACWCCGRWRSSNWSARSNEASASVPSIAGAAARVVAVLDTPDPVATARPTRNRSPPSHGHARRGDGAVARRRHRRTRPVSMRARRRRTRRGHRAERLGQVDTRGGARRLPRPASSGRLRARRHPSTRCRS